MLSLISEVFTNLRTRISGEGGQALTEYGLVLALIAIVCVIALTAVGLAVADDLDSFASALGGP